jgi:hypothetical protein
MQKPSVLFNHRYVPTWYHRFCEDALREIAEVTFVGCAGWGRPGFPEDLDIGDFFAKAPRPPDYYISSEDPLHLGLMELPCPTVLLSGDYWAGDHGRIKTARLFDHVFVAGTEVQRDFRNGGCKSVHFLPYAADTRCHRDFQMERIYDIGFVGFTHQGVQSERAVALAALAKRYKMNDYTKPAFDEEVGRIYSQSKIVVNFPNRGGFNMRVFESMAAGALLITEDVGNGQDELFEDRKHFVLYRDKAEIPRLVDYYLVNEAERLDISREGQREVLAKHTYRHRMEHVLKVLSEVGHQRNRATDRNEIIRAYGRAYGRNLQLDHLIREIVRGKGSLKTRLILFARFLQSIRTIIFPPRP